MRHLLVATALVLALGVERAPAAGSSAGCDASTAKSLVRAFVAGFDHGKVPEIGRLWAPEPRFQWYSTGRPGARLGPDAYNRAALGAYFRARVRVHEQIRITQLKARYERRRNIVNFSGKLIRSADDLRPRLHDFKEAADCVSGRPTLIVWSM